MANYSYDNGLFIANVLFGVWVNVLTNINYA